HFKRPSTAGLSSDERDFLYFKGRSNCNVRLPLPGRDISVSSDPMNYVFLEMGFRGSPNPIERVRLDSFVGEEIVQGRAGDAASLDEYKDDFYPFDFTLLHPTRTFVEKLLALHGAFFQGIEKVRTRHY